MEQQQREAVVAMKRELYLGTGDWTGESMLVDTEMLSGALPTDPTGLVCYVTSCPSNGGQRHHTRFIPEGHDAGLGPDGMVVRTYQDPMEILEGLVHIFNEKERLYLPLWRMCHNLETGACFLPPKPDVVPTVKISMNRTDNGDHIIVVMEETHPDAGRAVRVFTNDSNYKHSERAFMYTCQSIVDLLIDMIFRMNGRHLLITPSL